MPNYHQCVYRIINGKVVADPEPVLETSDLIGNRNISEATTYLVKQRSGRRWVVVGSFQSDATDSIQLREELRKFLWSNGIVDISKYCLERR